MKKQVFVRMLKEGLKNKLLTFNAMHFYIPATL